MRSFLSFLSFLPRIKYGVNCGRTKGKWIPIPRLREDKLHGNDRTCTSPNIRRSGNSQVNAVWCFDVIFTNSGPPYDPAFGSYQLRALLCDIEKEEPAVLLKKISSADG